MEKRIDSRFDAYSSEDGFNTMFRKMAEVVYEKQPYLYDKNKIWWQWNIDKYSWSICDETDIMIMIDSYIKVESENGKIKSSILEAFRKYGRSREPMQPGKRWIQFNDKIFDLENNLEFEASPNYFITNVIPWSIGESEDTPTIDKLFSEWVDKNYKETLYEIIAYCTLCDIPIQRLFCLIGGGANGKSTFIKMLNKFMGDDNVSSTTLQNLIGSNFGTTCLFKKLVTNISEVEKITLKQTGILKSLSGGDRIRIEYKGKNSFSDISYSKLILASNKLPSSTDNSDGFMRRWLIIDFPNRFPEKENIINSIPDEEYSNLAKKCIRILKKVLNEGHFTNDGEIEDRRTKYLEKSTNLKEFINENYDKSQNSFVVFTIFYQEYENYCKHNDFRCESKKTVGQMLNSFGYEKEIKGINSGFGDYTTKMCINGLKKLE